VSGGKFCSVWFPAKERGFAISLASISSPIGILIAFITPGLFVKGVIEVEELREQILNFNRMLMIIYVTLTIAEVLFLKDLPPKDNIV
jgi:sugar phosphate permease